MGRLFARIGLPSAGDAAPSSSLMNISSFGYCFASGVLALFLGCAGASSSASSPGAGEARTAVPATHGVRRAVPGFSSPESALYDPVADVYFVSNLAGSPAAKDGEGFVSRVSPDGKLLALRFADGHDAGRAGHLDAPKGLALIGRVLFAADIDVVRRFDADTGASKGSIAIPGAVFLNDLSAGPDGALFVTDSALRESEGNTPSSKDDAVLRIDEPAGAARVHKVAQGDFLGHPNGIVALADRLEVVSFGTGEWLTLGLDGVVRARLKLPGGALDGLIAIEDGTFVASSWATSSLYQFGVDRAPRLAAADLPSPADIGYDGKRHVVLVPRLLSNELVLLSL